jgi:hypothetical protein
MYRTSARPAPVEFLLPPTHSIPFGIDRRKDICLQSIPQLPTSYFEAPIRDGLRTPPADDMSTTYQHTQYHDHAGRQDGTYSTSSSSRQSYAGSYSGANTQPKPYAVLGQPTQPSASTLRNEIQACQTPCPQPPSPQLANETNALADTDGLPRRKNANSEMISPNLQIPSSINNSGGSLAEFAAQVIIYTVCLWGQTLMVLRLRACSGLSRQRPSKKLRNYRRPLLR